MSDQQYCESCEERFADSIWQGQRLCGVCRDVAAGATGLEGDLDDHADYEGRHKYCVRLIDQVRAYARNPQNVVYRKDDDSWWNRYPSGQEVQIRGYCDHPEDFFCAIDAPAIPALDELFAELRQS